MSKTYRDYSADDKALALTLLKANKGNLSATSRETDIAISTLASWRDGQGVSDQVSDLCDEKTAPLADLFERISRKYLAHANKEEVINSTKGKDSVTAAAIAADKMQLLRGNATSITHSLTEDEKKAELARLYEEQREEDRRNAEKLIG